MLEFYQAYANYHDLMADYRGVIAFVAQEVNGTTITNFNGVEIDLSKWTRQLWSRRFKNSGHRKLDRLLPSPRTSKP